VGSLAGLGGGIIVVPALTLLFGVDIHYATGAAIISVIATSSGSTISYLRQGLCNVRLGMFLELATAAGAVVGAGLAGVLAGRWLYVIFGVVLLVSAGTMLGSRGGDAASLARSDRLARRLRLQGSYYDRAACGQVRYGADRTPLGFAVMGIAGVFAGLLGIGAGVFKVMAMDRAMGLPIKVSTATSSFMIGVTGAAGAAVYVSRGDVHPLLAGPVALGVLAGAAVGARVLPHLPAKTVRRVFVVVLAVVAVRMLIQGLTGAGG